MPVKQWWGDAVQAYREIFTSNNRTDIPPLSEVSLHKEIVIILPLVELKLTTTWAFLQIHANFKCN